MKTIFLLLYLSSWAPSKCLQSNNADAIVGRWESTRNNLIVDVYKEGNIYKARVVWFKNNIASTKPSDTWRDDKNPDSSLRSRKILGMDVVKNLIYDEKNNRWEKGEIYDSTTGKTWSSTASLTGDGMLKVRGFWRIELIGQTLLFKRI